MPLSLRVGSVPYVVGRPLDDGLGDEPGIRLEHDVPSRLVERLRAGEIDVAMVSSIELFRRPGYRYLDGLAVAGNGYVGSVQLFLRRPLDEVATVALDPASRTARALLRVLLAERPGGAPALLEVPPGTDPRGVAADAWLRIGDVALREHLRERLPSFNPSAEWARRTGLPFVFAPWIVRPGVDLEPHVGAFLRARARGAARVRETARGAAGAWGLSVEECRDYLERECVYELGDRMRGSLLAFRDRAAALGLCDGSADPEPIGLGELRA